MTNKFKPNPDLYTKLSTPRPRAEVHAAIAAFGADVRAARDRHGIAELLCVFGAVVEGAEEGDAPSTAIAVMSYGDTTMLPTLALAARDQARRAHVAAFDKAFATGADDEEDREP